MQALWRNWDLVGVEALRSKSDDPVDLGIEKVDLVIGVAEADLVEEEEEMVSVLVIPLAKRPLGVLGLMMGLVAVDLVVI